MDGPYLTMQQLQKGQLIRNDDLIKNIFDINRSNFSNSDNVILMRDLLVRRLWKMH